LHNGFLTAQNQLNSKLGIYHGQTQTFEELLQELSQTTINVWRGIVFNVFPEGTANATAIFPRDRQPFQQDTYDQRVGNVEALSITLATYTTHPALVSLSAAVHTYHLTLTGARALQQTDEGSVGTLRSNLRTAHGIMCTGLYRNLGKLMAKYADTPVIVINYFDLTLLRTIGDVPSVIINGPITHSTILNLNPFFEAENIQPIATTRFRISNLSQDEQAALTFYPASTADAPPGPGVQFTIQPGFTIEKTMEELGLIAFAFFNVQNASLFEGTWEIEIIE
jgi:hypothetical protein